LIRNRLIKAFLEVGGSGGCFIIFKFENKVAMPELFFALVQKKN
jgi:hypothetical protein